MVLNILKTRNYIINFTFKVILILCPNTILTQYNDKEIVKCHGGKVVTRRKYCVGIKGTKYCLERYPAVSKQK